MTTITIDRALLEQALEALMKSHTCPLLPDDCENAITALRAALAQEQAEPVQEPITRLFGTLPVHDAPAKPEPLTEEEIDAMWREAASADGFTTAQFVRNFARAVERALEEKNRGR